MAAVTFAGSAILRDMDEDARLQQLINGFRTSQAIAVAVELGIPDLIGDGRRSSEDLAAATSTDPPSLYRLLRALAAAGVLHEDEARTFALTPLGGRFAATSRRASLAGRHRSGATISGAPGGACWTASVRARRLCACSMASTSGRTARRALTIARRSTAR